MRPFLFGKQSLYCLRIEKVTVRSPFVLTLIKHHMKALLRDSVIHQCHPEAV